MSRCGNGPLFARSHKNFCARPVLLASPELSVAIDCACQFASFLELQVQPAQPLALWASVSLAVSLAMPLGTLIRPFVAGEMLALSGLSVRNTPDSTGGASHSAVDCALTLRFAESVLSGGGSSAHASLSSISASGADVSGSSRTPSWRICDVGAPLPKRTRVALCIEETIESHQYDRAGGGGDTAKLSGRITLYSDYPVLPTLEVTMKIHLAVADSDRLSCDPCVTVFTATSDATRATTNSTAAAPPGSASTAKTIHLTAVPALKCVHTVLRYEAPPPACAYSAV